MLANRVMQVIGILSILMGLLWLGQGTGVIRWPVDSFMVDMRPWAWRGAALAAAGLALAWWATVRKPD